MTRDPSMAVRSEHISYSLSILSHRARTCFRLTSNVCMDGACSGVLMAVLKNPQIQMSKGYERMKNEGKETCTPQISGREKEILVADVETKASFRALLYRGNSNSCCFF